MSEYIILLIIFTLLLYAFIYLVKGIKSIAITENNSILNNNTIFDKKLLLKNNLEELEIDFLSQKLDEAEYKNLKNNMQEEINSIKNNIPAPDTKKESSKLICQNCSKEIEPDSKFCKYCGNKINP